MHETEQWLTRIGAWLHLPTIFAAAFSVLDAMATAQDAMVKAKLKMKVHPKPKGQAEYRSKIVKQAALKKVQRNLNT